MHIGPTGDPQAVAGFFDGAVPAVYDTLSRCLPLGICASDAPLWSAAFALSHVAGAGW